jgi:hypothetical protein
MKICFVGHDFHRKSRSHAFFLRILSSLGEVTEHYHSPDDQHGPSEKDIAEQILAHSYDRVVFWQTEGIACEMLPWLPKEILLVPMWDAAMMRPAEFWKRFHAHSFISFSRQLHELLQVTGLRSYHFQYFAEPVSDAGRVSVSEPVGGFFWERRPREALNAELVYQQALGLGLSHLHVHAAPDFRRDRSFQLIRLKALARGNVKLSRSEWFDDRGELDAVIRSGLFYFAPRQYEGIGMSFIEALGRGQIVVAPDLPTMNEYIGHMTSGILYDPQDPFSLKSLRASSLKAISDGAYARARFGYEEWLKDVDRLKSIVLGDGRRWAGTDVSSHFGTAIRRAAHHRALRSTGKMAKT